MVALNILRPYRVGVVFNIIMLLLVLHFCCQCSVNQISVSNRYFIVIVDRKVTDVVRFAISISLVCC